MILKFFINTLILMVVLGLIATKLLGLLPIAPLIPVVASEEQIVEIKADPVPTEGHSVWVTCPKCGNGWMFYDINAKPEEHTILAKSPVVNYEAENKDLQVKLSVAETVLENVTEERNQANADNETLRKENQQQRDNIAAVMLDRDSLKSKLKAQPVKPSGITHSSFESAAKEAEATKLPVLVMFTASWCGPCHQMENAVLPSPIFKDAIKDKYILAIVDADMHPETVAEFYKDKRSFPGRPYYPECFVWRTDQETMGHFDPPPDASAFVSRLKTM